MKITALEEYGLRCMLALAKSWPDKSVTMPQLGAMEKLSVPYVGKLMMILKRAGLVKAVRGRNGGYVLAAAPDQLRLDRVLNALGEPIYSTRHCARYSGEAEICVHIEECNVRNMWATFNDFVNDVLRRMTLADLITGDYRLTFATFKRLSEMESPVDGGDNGNQQPLRMANDTNEIQTYN
jgi:Rrf2 family transcriptional regulator, iron-sulfur cluster assembly transcription factor